MKKILSIFLIFTLFLNTFLNAENLVKKETKNEQTNIIKDIAKVPVYVVVGATGIVYYGVIILTLPFAFVGDKIVKSFEKERAE